MYYHPKFYTDSLKRNILNDNINMMINIKGLIIVTKKEHMGLSGIKIKTFESKDKEVDIIIRFFRSFNEKIY